MLRMFLQSAGSQTRLKPACDDYGGKHFILLVNKVFCVTALLLLLLLLATEQQALI